MLDSASEHNSLWPILLAVAPLTLVFAGMIPLAGCAADPREELQRRASELFHAGVECYQREEIGPALEKTKQSLQIYEQLYPKSEYPAGHTDLAESLNAMGFLLMAQGADGDARAYYERALSIRQALCPKEKYPKGDPDLATSLDNMGMLLMKLGADGDARSYLERGLQMRQALYPKERYPRGHADLAASLCDLGDVLLTQVAYKEARGYCEQALSMNQALYPKEQYPHGHADLAASLNNMGAVLHAQGSYGESRSYSEQALAMYQALYPAEQYPHGHADLAASLENFGVSLRDQGAYSEARGYLERALAVYQALYAKELYPKGRLELARSLSNLASTLQAQGAYGEARGYYERALAMCETLYPKERYPQGVPYLARSLLSLGALLEAQGVYSEARGYVKRGLDMTQSLYPRTRYPDGHPELAESLNSMANLLIIEGAPGEAHGYLERALAMRQALYPRDRYPQGHPLLAASMRFMGQLLRTQGAYGEARGYGERSLAMDRALYPKEQYPSGHPHLAASLNILGALFRAQGLYGDAKALLQEGVDMQQSVADVIVAGTSEVEAMNYLGTLPLFRDSLISACLHVPGSDEASYARVWRGKAAVARMLNRRQAELSYQAAANPATRRAVENWREVRDQLSRLILARSAGRDHSDRLARIQRLSAEKERLERQMAEAVPEFGRRQALERSSHTGLVEALPKHVVVIDLASYTHAEQNPQVKGDKGKRLTPSYIGFVLAQGRPVRAVDLGPAALVDHAVGTWREAIKSRKAGPGAEILRRTVWDPLARHFAPETTTVVLALDGRLTAVPWAALPGDKPGTVLLEQYALATVPYAPFLLDRLTAPTTETDDRGIFLAVGGVAYDQAPKPVDEEKIKLELLAARQPETTRGRADAWKDLPGTLHELNAVTELAGSRTVIRLEGVRAGTAQLLGDLPSARWAHIATHGFFADPSVPSVLRPDPKLFASIGSERVGASLRNPLVLSGLVLAGANRPSADLEGTTHDDLGILTAEAIAGLPLQDLELVVLSACETGLGLVGGGEGVFGLQRAFHLAGAHNVIASLWRVDDQATAALMAIFYDQLWRHHKPPIEALRIAQLTLYRHPERIGELAKARGTPDFDKLVRRPEPVHDDLQPAPTERAPIEQWAAFVLSGWGK